MPVYEYRCPECGDHEVEQRITDRPLEACGRCGSPVRRLISQSSFALKGAGWAGDGYSSSTGDSCNGRGPQGGCGGPCSKQ
jgi:putative FmdB family regulatory protein